MCVGVVVAFSCHSDVGFLNSNNAAMSDFFFLFFLTCLAKQNKQTEEYCSFHTINGSVCPCTVSWQLEISDSQL